MHTSARAKTERAAELFHALSDRTRLDLIEQLRRGERCVCELTGALDAAQSRLSFHLKVLKDAGIVSDRRDGRWVHYELREPAFAELHKLLSALEPRIEQHAAKTADCC